MSDDPIKSDGLFSEFFFDLICRVIPGAVVIYILISQVPIISEKLSMLKEESGTLSVLVFFMACWVLGCVIDILTYDLLLRAWNFIRPRWNSHFALKMGDGENDFACLTDGVSLEIRRKMEKHAAESAMLRNLTFIFSATGIWLYNKTTHSQASYYFLAAFITALAFWFLRRRTKRMIALKKPTYLRKYK